MKLYISKICIENETNNNNNSGTIKKTRLLKANETTKSWRNISEDKINPNSVLCCKNRNNNITLILD